MLTPLSWQPDLQVLPELGHLEGPPDLNQIQDVASPTAIAEAAVRSGCRSVAFTYNDPVIFLEYAVDVGQACRDRGIKTVAVSAGYISPARVEFFRHMDRYLALAGIGANRSCAAKEHN